MLVSDDVWRDAFKRFSEDNNGVLKITKDPSVGYPSDYITCSVHIKFHDNSIVLRQNGVKGNDGVGISFLSLEYKYDNPKKLSLSINQRDFFDKFFSRKSVKTGVRAFDEQFTINCTDESIAKKVFREERVQNLFMKNNLLTFNIQTEKNLTTIKFRSMEVKLYTVEDMQTLADDFKFIIDRVLT